jgi:hypothetical protein
MGSSDDFLAGSILGLLGGFLIALCIGALIISDVSADWEKQAIEHGAAQYNPITSQFEWKEKTDAK